MIKPEIRKQQNNTRTVNSDVTLEVDEKVFSFIVTIFLSTCSTQAWCKGFQINYLCLGLRIREMTEPAQDSVIDKRQHWVWLGRPLPLMHLGAPRQPQRTHEP